MRGNGKILIMAAGTGGHVFPALSIAHCLARQGINVEWLGTPTGMENELLHDSNFKLHRIAVSGLRGSGVLRKLTAPVMLSRALHQSLRTIRGIKPDCVLGMGGFICGPAGVATRLLGIPLLIHEQNAVAGLTNRLLARIANLVMEAFPNTFAPGNKVRTLGNPLRQEIIALAGEPHSTREPYRPLQILVLGGSRGAEAINRVMPEVLVNWGDNSPAVYHQTGARNHSDVDSLYRSLAIEPDARIRVVPFIADMAAAYRWADLVIARSGASTVSELAAVGLPSILVPYPHHRDQQQLLNARWLVDKGGAQLLEQRELSAKTLLPMLRELDLHRERLEAMGINARKQAIVDAAESIARECREFIHA